LRHEIDHPEMINSRRNQLGMTIIDTAEFVGIAYDKLANYEMGRIRTIETPTLEVLGEVLECSPSLFCSAYEERERHVSSVYVNVHLLKEHLYETGKTANQLATEAGVHASVIYGFTRRGRRACKATTAMKIAKAMRVKPEMFSPALGMYPPVEEAKSIP
jgi:DNA-binding Xre family transcriptional regulator/DNA-binding XRE family transcriptional regulator